MGLGPVLAQKIKSSEPNVQAGRAPEDCKRLQRVGA